MALAIELCFKTPYFFEMLDIVSRLTSKTEMFSGSVIGSPLFEHTNGAIIASAIAPLPMNDIFDERLIFLV